METARYQRQVADDLTSLKTGNRVVKLPVSWEKKLRS